MEVKAKEKEKRLVSVCTNRKCRSIDVVLNRCRMCGSFGVDQMTPAQVLEIHEEMKADAQARRDKEATE